MSKSKKGLGKKKPLRPAGNVLSKSSRSACDGMATVQQRVMKGRQIKSLKAAELNQLMDGFSTFGLEK
jgi:hypothetical protein